MTVARALLKGADWWGIIFASVGLSLIYAALDQGDRLDWLNSGLIKGLLTGGIILLVAFVLHERGHERPWINLGFAVSGNIPFVVLLIAFFRFVILSTVVIIPQYLTVVQHYRAMEIGGVLLWIALPQLLLAPLVATILRFVDPRITLGFGFAMVGLTCFMAAQLTAAWAGDDFLPSQIIQAIGQSFALTSLVWFALRHVDFSQIFAFGALVQTGRLFGGEVGTAFIQTFLRVREQIHSNLLGLHVTGGSFLTDQRLHGYAQAFLGRSVGQAEANARATSLLARSVQAQAYVLAEADGFMILGFFVIAVLLLVVLLRDPPPLPVPPAQARAAKATA
jgi:DHA2 family multidrug resistance protein